ncbi:MAG: hypothetical protein JSW53_03240 [Candidatus Bathyarchaeota archaeon]|nr:MAG: hypothetical protein JSW53_03240 [Candidatus Bathyarchaeota archaeon]
MHQSGPRAVGRRSRLLLATIFILAVTVVWAIALYQHLQAYNRHFLGHREVLMDFQGNGVVYRAYEYESETPPPEWYTPEELGIYEIIEYGEFHFLTIKCIQFLQEEQPIFKYKDKFYKVPPLELIRCDLPGLREPWWTWGNGSILMGLGMILIIAWIILVAEWQKALKPSS